MTGYQALAEFRYQIRRFLHLSERAARSAGLEPQQHQLLLLVRALPAGEGATIGTLAARLLLRHHSVVELVDRLQTRRLVVRRRDPRDRRRVQVHLTPQGDRLLRRLTRQHRRLLRQAGPALIAALEQVLASSVRSAAARRPNRWGPRRRRRAGGGEHGRH